jgi:hypothetical protein
MLSVSDQFYHEGKEIKTTPRTMANLKKIKKSIIIFLNGELYGRKYALVLFS